MLATQQKRDLFGGALRCAGLVAATTMSSSAIADFVPVIPPFFSYSSNLAYDHNFDTLVSNINLVFDANFTPQESYAGPGGTLNSYSSATLIGVSAYANNATWLYGAAGVGQYFSVDNAKKAYIEWDITNAPYRNYGRVYQLGVGMIFDIGTPLEVAGDSGSLSGSYSITLLPGETYYIRFLVGAGEFAGGDGGYIRMTWVPAPGAFALLGIGMIGTRRRRRE